MINEPSFIGALAGATISGGLALYINSLERNRSREKETEESQKILLVFRYLATDLSYQLTKLIENMEESNKIYNPYSNIETYEDDEGRRFLQYFPREEEIADFDITVDPYLKKIKAASMEALEIYRKVEQVNINVLHLKDLNSILKFKSDFKRSIEPKLLMINKIKNPRISFQDLDVMKVVSDSFLNLTNNN